MKKILIGLSLVLAISFVFPAFGQTTAQTSTPSQVNQQLVESLKALIEQLQKQVAELQVKVQALIQARLQVKEQAKEVKEALEDIKDLRKGMTSEEIRAIQQILATDPTIYPEGLITGYFGPATEKALKRFMERYGIKDEKEDKIGEKTLNRLRELLEERKEIKLENGAKCLIVPPGTLIAPGLVKKSTSSTPTLSNIPECQVIPDGIQKLMRLRLNWDLNTPTLTPSPTPSPTLTPSPSPSPSPTPTPTPTSTASSTN